MITVTVKPKLKVLMTSSLTGDPATLPHICWQFVVIQNPSSSNVVDPVLTFARDTTINFYQVKREVKESQCQFLIFQAGTSFS